MVNAADTLETGQALGARLAREALDPLKSAFVGKDELVDLLGVCLAGGENLFVLGPPGTAKSAVVRELGRRLDGRTFEYLLTRFTEPNELFGPFDIRRLREGELVTNTEGMLPEAALLFLDELLNANSAILNGLLGVLNERVFRRGKETRPLPLLMAVGASNRLPEDETLGALFDRFLLRARCDNVPGERLGEVLTAGWRLDARERSAGFNGGGNGSHAESKTAEPAERAAGFRAEDVRRLQSCVGRVDMDGVRPALAALALRLRQAGITVSDRRAVKLQRLAAASALLCGRAKAEPSDLWIFKHIWDTEEQQEVLAALVDEQLKKDTSGAQAHPRSRAAEAPDPEALARDLEALELLMDMRQKEFELVKHKPGSPEGAEIAALKDRLGALSSRVDWIKAEEPRAFLRLRCEALWKKWK